MWLIAFCRLYRCHSDLLVRIEFSEAKGVDNDPTGHLFN